MTAITGKHAFLELLRQEGVEILFGNPGTTELSLMDALAVEDRPRYVLGLHEGVAMAMAHGYAAATGRLAAVNLHAAPGLGNALGMLYNCKKAGAPVLVTAGQHDTRICLTEPLLWDDLAVMARPYVKWSAQVQTLAELPRAVHRACKVALTPPTGPVFLSIPDDVLTASGELDLMAPTRVGASLRGDLAAIETAARLIAAAESPLVFAGDAVAQSRAHAELIRLVELIGAPVYSEAMADTASFPTSHPLFAGLVPRLATSVRSVMADHDLVVSIGGDLFTQSLPSDVEAFAPGTKIVHLDLDPWELGKNFPTEAAVFGDPKATLPELSAAVERHMDAAATARAQSRRAAIAARTASRLEKLIAQARAEAAAMPLKPLAVLAAIGETLPGDAVVIDELLSSNPGVRHLIRSDDPQSYFGLRGGGIGMGLPQAVGAKLAMPDRPVVALVGDGSALYSLQALWTAAHERIAVTFVIFDNRSYRILKQRTKALGDHAARTGAFVAMDLDDPPIDFVGMARALGVEASRASSLPDVVAALRNALDGNAPRLIEVMIDDAL